MNAVVWADPEQAEFVRQVAERAGLTIVAAGSPEPSEGTRTAQALEVDAETDLRQALLRDGLGVVWFATALPLSADERRLVRERDVLVFSTEPRPSSLADASQPGENETSFFVPLMRRSPGFLAARDVFESFGEVRCINIAFRGGRGHGTLFARLFDAMDTVEAICGQAVQVDATLSGPTSSAPELLSALRGHLTANLRFSENRGACVAVSDSAGRWFRGVTILGEGGCLRIDDGSFEWIAPDGSRTDHHESKVGPDPVSIFAEQMRRRIDRLDASPPVVEMPIVLALCEATRLSARTGQPETPRKMLELMGRT